MKSLWQSLAIPLLVLTSCPAGVWGDSASPVLLSKEDANKLVFLSPRASPYVFSGEALPELDFESPATIREWIGPYTIDTTFYNAAHEEVTAATEPGRYGAVAEIHSAHGTLKRFITLFRTPEDVGWWRTEVTASLALPEGTGIDQDVMNTSKELGDMITWQLRAGLERDPNLAVLFAGVYDRGDDARDYGFYESVWIADRQWWVEQKRILYGWDQRWPEPFVAPRRIDGEPAPALRDGTFAEAEMNPGIEAELDAMLAAWADEGGEPLAVCLARHGVLFYHKAFGTLDGEPMTVNTLRGNASFTKFISGTLWGMFLDQGVVSLDEPVATYLPPLQYDGHDTPITARRLYNHTADFEGHWGDDQSDMEERVVSLLPHLKVGKRHFYAGSDMGLACKVLEAVTGKCLPLIYKEYLFDPLGCEHVEADYAAFNSRGTPLDLAKIAQLHLNGGSYGPWRFFGEDGARRLRPEPLGPQVQEGKDNAPYGMGTMWHGAHGLSPYTYSHGAASGTIVRMDPVQDLVIAMTRENRGFNYTKFSTQFVGTVTRGIINGARLPNVFEDLAAAGIDADGERGAMHFDYTVRNGGEEPFVIAYVIDTNGTTWSASSVTGRVAIAGGRDAQIEWDFSFDPVQPLPTPIILTTIRYGDRQPILMPVPMRPRLQRTTEAVRLAAAPAIDGVISPGEYPDAPFTSDFRAVARPVIGDMQTRFCLGYDDDSLYMAAVAEADDPGALPRITRERDGELWLDPSMELFIDANHDHATYYHLIANLRGDRYDGIGGSEHGKFGSSKWNAEWQTAAQAHEDHYVLEIAVPWSELGVDAPKPGDSIGLHIGRTRPPSATGDKSDFTGWAIVYTDFHQVTHFGDVTFR